MILPIALDRDGRVKFVHMLHEESGAFAASAEAQLTGRLAASLSVSFRNSWSRQSRAIPSLTSSL
ncbi:MAG: hypothetical protein HDS62_05165 [Bacteroidales bacterium]|nr:hypothetical protein [Bacteroidales bacterium]